MKVTPVLRSARMRIESVFLNLLGLLLGLLVCTEVLQVLGRYFFGFSFIWVQDILSLTLLFIGWLGGAYLWFKKEHLTVEIIRLKMSFINKWIHPISDLVAVLVVVSLLPSIVQAMTSYSSLRLDGLNVSASVRFLPCLTGMVLLGVAAGMNFLDFVIARNNHCSKSHG